MKAICNLFKKINQIFLLRFQSYIMTIAMWGLIIVMTLTIIARNILHIELLSGTEELLSLFSAWMYFMGGSLASYEDSHISADLIHTLCKTNLAKAIHKLFICVVTVFVCVVGSSWALKWALNTAEYNAKSAIYGYPLVLMYIPVFICLILTVIYYIGHAVTSIKIIREEMRIGQREGGEAK